MPMGTSEGLRRLLGAGCVLACLLLSACASTGQQREDRALSLARADSPGQISERAFAAALFLSAEGDYIGALQGYRKLLAEQPDNAALWFSAARAFHALGSLDSARVYSERSVALNSRNRYYLGLLATIAHQEEDYPRAIAVHRELSNLDRGNTELLGYLALEYLAAEQHAEALKVFGEILVLDPRNEMAHFHSLLLQIRMERYAEAIASLKKMMGEDGGSDRLRLTLGELYLRTGDYPKAAETFRFAVSVSPGFVPGWLALLNVSVRTGEQSAFLSDLNSYYDISLRGLEKQLELARYYLAKAATEPLYLEPAALMLDVLARRHPESPEPMALSGFSKLSRGAALGAAEDFRRAIAIKPDKEEFREYLVGALLAGKQYEEALREVRLAQRRLPESALRFSVLEGFVLFQADRIKDAAQLLRRALLKPAIRKEAQRELRQRALGTLAFCYDRLGTPRKSIPLYQLMLKLDSSNALVMNNLAYTLASQPEELPRARELAEKAVALEPESGVYLDTLGWIMYLQAEYRSALSVLEKAAALEPQEAEIFSHLGNLYLKLGDPEKAKEMRRKAELIMKKAP
ncbi:MAG: tetratricopeptide repeat protein [Chlorobium sp.]|nr:tetratricopeptide repeat protein [Chlorobium phaeovibrioides]NQU46667.1 tetratricopeptide repeat protein [Chlorobium sp.]